MCVPGEGEDGRDGRRLRRGGGGGRVKCQNTKPKAYGLPLMENWPVANAITHRWIHQEEMAGDRCSDLDAGCGREEELPLHPQLPLLSFLLWNDSVGMHAPDQLCKKKRRRKLYKQRVRIN